MKGSLKALLGLEFVPPNVAMPTGSLYKHLPWEAPEAYLHTIFNPVDSASLSRISKLLSIPQEWQAFLSKQNGAVLYFNSIYFYGVTTPGHLLDRRSDVRFPFSIESANAKSRLSQNNEWLYIGGYGHFGSLVLLSGITGSIQALSRNGDKVLSSWANKDEWLESELKRLSMLFTPDGRLLTDGAFTDPAHESFQHLN